MNLVNGIFVNTILINACVIAKGSHGGHGSHSSHSSHSTHGSHTSHGSHGYHHVKSSHSHYTYHPPKQIHYTCRHCSSYTSYPVYKHQLPHYVYVYKDSGGRYDQLLTGLAMYNLGRSVEESHSTHHQAVSGSYYPSQRYSAYQQENCSLQVIENHHFEETEFPCFMLSSFIESSPANNTNTIDITSSDVDVKPDLNTGDPLNVTEDQECVLWRNLSSHNERNQVPCALLKEYANTVTPSVAPVYIWLPLVGTGLLVYLCYDCICKKEKEDVKEAAALNDVAVASYRTN